MGSQKESALGVGGGQKGQGSLDLEAGCPQVTTWSSGAFEGDRAQLQGILLRETPVVSEKPKPAPSQMDRLKIPSCMRHGGICLQFQASGG